MQSAEITSFIKTLLWVAIGWFILKTVSRFVRTGSNVHAASRKPAERRPGEVSIDKRTPPKKAAVDENAEFVDFEEVSEKKGES